MSIAVELKRGREAAPTPVDAIAGMRRLRWNLIRNTVSEKLTSSRLRLAMVVFFSALFWVGLFGLFLEGFLFLNHHQMLRVQLTELLFGLFFGSILVMLVFSTGIIIYGGLFDSEEAGCLLAMPVPADQIFAFKFQEAMFFSCWGFMLLGSPMMIAYGWVEEAPPTFYLMALAYFVAFAFVPGSAGAIICLFVTHFFPRRRRQFVTAISVACIAAIVVVAARFWVLTRGEMAWRNWLNEMVRQLRVSNLPFLPSQWIARGLIASGQADRFSDAVFYLLLLASNGLFIYLIAAAAHRRFYRQAYDRAHSDMLLRRRRASSWLPAIIDRLFAPLPPSLRVLVVKDIRTFTRDPRQWLQVVIFTSLLILYVVTLGRMNYYTDSPYWRNLIGFFNLAVTGLILSTYTSRFIFPLLSLEGQKFWILGLCPVSRDAILWGKFAFAAGGAVLVTLSLTLLSAFMLRLEPPLVGLQLVTVLILCLGISGISVGLGARFPELEETDPSRIAAGFGGTLNLVASLVFLLIVVALMAIPCHLYSITQTIEQGTSVADIDRLRDAAISVEGFQTWMIASIVSSLIIGAAAAWLPMHIGIRAFRRREF